MNKILQSIQILLLLSICSNALDLNATRGYDIRTKHLRHPSAYIPSMCYTKTVDSQGKKHNPCYACHTRAKAPNFTLDDESLQAAYNFPDPALKNPFSNLFKDYSQAVSKISDEQIDAYVKRSNYFDEEGRIVLARKLRNLPAQWDENGDGKWSGYVPDCYYRFDRHGLDHAPDGHATGWAAFAYTPFPGTFWPTNGSTDDVLIRLPRAFGLFKQGGDFNETLYRINLSIVEAMIQRKSIPIDPVDEKKLGIDLDKNGRLGIANRIAYEWAPKEGKRMSYVGEAKKLLQEGKLHIAAGLFPEGTEFLHSVRYLGLDANGSVILAPRMKELRYARKVAWASYAALHNKALADYKEGETDPEQLESFPGSMEQGVSNRMGWIYQGFIEDRFGSLRPQSYEETLNCMGCHSGIGATTDGTFAFARKLDASRAWRRGWYHWSRQGLQGIPEPRLHDGSGEYARYLRLNHSGNEFRSNDEVLKKFFTPRGELKAQEIQRLRRDISTLLLPSKERARKLNKAYRALVREQRFIEGRAPHISPLTDTVWRELNASQPTHLKIVPQ